LLSRRAVGLALGGVTLAASSIFTTGPTAAQPPAATANPSAAGKSASPTMSGEVTLVTGDRVRVSADGAVTVISAPRPGVHISTSVHNGHRLDARLFDVTTLLESGYDSRRGSVPLIVVHDKGARDTARTALAAGGARVGLDLGAANAVAVEASQTSAWATLTEGTGRARGLRQGIREVWLDGLRRVTLDHSVPQVGAPAAWAAGFNGTGVRVAVVDTGIDATHPDLSGKVVGAQNFTTEPTAEDLMGHGTHVASTIAGSGAASGGLNRGVAPGATLLSAKVCTGSGACPESWTLAGMQWAAQQGADVINMSLGGSDLPGVDPLEQAVGTLTASHGVLFVIAAGNTGPSNFTVGSPGSADAALTVGAVDDFDTLVGFSSQGPRVGDTAMKPDIAAPGVDINAARSSTSPLPGGSYTNLSGTSMATPHVAGAAAILAQRRPTWTPAQLKAGLMASAAPQAFATAFGQGAGRLRVDREINQTVLASPPSISLGRQIAPHSDDPVLTRTITYQNTNTSSGTTLTLTVDGRDPSGNNPAPSGMFSLSAGTVTLAPGGSASVTFTTDTRVAGPEGLYGGWVTATGGAGSISVSTPFGVHRADGAEITFHLRNRAGQYAPRTEIMMMPITGSIVHFWELPTGPTTLWVPAGVYLVKYVIPEDVDYVGGATVMVDQRMTVSSSGPTTVNVNASAGAPIAVTGPNSAAQHIITEVAAKLLENEVEVLVGSTFIDAGMPHYTGVVGSTATVPGFLSKIRRTFMVPSGGPEPFHNSPTSYDFAWFPTPFPVGFTRNVTTGQLATVQAAHASQVNGLAGKGTNAHPAGALFRIGSIVQSTFDLPFSRTEFYNNDSGLRWEARFTDYLGTTVPYVDVDSAPTAFSPGTTTSQTWNKPVYGPGLGALSRPEHHVVRNGDVIQFYPPLLGDNAGRTGHPYVGATGQLTLKRGTQVLASVPYPYPPSLAVANVPPELNTYTLEATLNRDVPPAVLSTQISAVWTFRSATVAWNQYTRLPLWYVTFRPVLNAANSAPASTTNFSVPLTAAAQPTSSPGSLSTITVQYSVNDGATWTNASLTGTGANRTARVNHPAGSGFVSLRATVTDNAGNAVTQTMIRAYRYA
jgi:subtilisin family serine protease